VLLAVLLHTLSATPPMPSIQKLQDIIGTDAGNRGMKSLIVDGDLEKASHILATSNGSVIILSGFPCCVQHSPPTETDGPPGSAAIARAAVALGYTSVAVVTDTCNQEVFAAALEGLDGVNLVCFPADFTEADRSKLKEMASSCDLLIACERAGPAASGRCYTMRGTDMKGLVAPLELFVECKKQSVPFIGIGDGGNELGMGKVLDRLHAHPTISNDIACVTKADYLIAASVSNWGGYALAAGAAMAKSQHSGTRKEWVDKCVPTRQEEIDLLNRCVEKGCRDGVSGKVEATVDGMPLETSLQCLADLTTTALGSS